MEVFGVTLKAQTFSITFLLTKGSLDERWLCGDACCHDFPSLCFLSFMALCQSLCMCLLYWKVQLWTQHSRCFSSAEQKRRITSLSLLAMFCLMQPRRMFGFCCKDPFLVHGQPGVHSEPQVLCRAAVQLLGPSYAFVHQHLTHQTFYPVCP